MNNFITITEPVFSKGKYFKQKEQYCYTDRLMLDVTCPLCAECYIGQIIMHYRIVIDGDFFYIPYYAAVIADCVYNPIDQNMRARKIFEEDQQPKDFTKAYKDVLGKTIDNKYEADRNRKKEMRDINFATYGNTDMSKLKSPLPRPPIPECPVCDTDETIYPLTKVTLDPEYHICFGSVIELIPTIEGLEERLTFRWSTGETTRNISVSPEEDTVYYLIVKDDLGCEYYATTIVYVHTLIVDISESPFSPPLLTAIAIGTDIDNLTYLWNTGETTQMITGTIPGSEYSVTVTGEYCEVTATIIIA